MGAAGSGGAAGQAGSGGIGIVPQHVWVANLPLSVPAGTAACIEGPYSIPGGGSIVYDISDSGDNMDVSVVSDGSACDGSTGFAVTSSTAWSGLQSVQANTLNVGLYDLAITCYNLTADCTPYLNAFGYQDP
jgi:hypothetical protein